MTEGCSFPMKVKIDDDDEEEEEEEEEEEPSPWQLYHIESLHLPGHPYTAVVLEATINGTLCIDFVISLAEIECGYF